MGGVNFGVPFCGIYMGFVPLIGLQILQYSQQSPAAEIFRIAPLPGPAALCHGARRAVLCLLVLPMLLILGLIVWLLRENASQLLLFLPGIIALPVFALVPHFRGHGVPLSMPPDAAKSAGRGLKMLLAMIPAFGLAALASVAWDHKWYWWLLLAEVVVAVILYLGMRASLNQARWPEED
jgi:hypothetical protein